MTSGEVQGKIGSERIIKSNNKTLKPWSYQLTNQSKLLIKRLTSMLYLSIISSLLLSFSLFSMPFSPVELEAKKQGTLPCWESSMSFVSLSSLHWSFL